MARNAKLFGRLLNEGLTSAAKKREIAKREIEHQLGDLLGYGIHTVQHWQRGNLPTEIDLIEETVRFVTVNGRVDRQWAQRVLEAADYLPEAAVNLLNELFAVKPQVFVCYQRGSRPDEPLAFEIARAISPDYDVFFDQAETLDAAWSRRMLNALKKAAHVIVLLSAESVRSEIVITAVKRAHNYRIKQGQPNLLPVRVSYFDPFPEMFAQRLNELPWALWRESEDTESLIETLQEALRGESLPIQTAVEKQALLQEPEAADFPVPAPQVEMPEGAIPLESPFYLERSSDRIVQQALTRHQGATIVIKGARQVGKTSLLIRLMRAAENQGKRVAFLDFQMFKSALDSADDFFRLFARLLAFRLGLPDETEMFWNFPLTNPFRTTEYISSSVLPALDQPVLLAMDEVEAVFDTDFRTDFFGMLRAWHSNRAIDPIWKKLDLVLVTSTEPYFFIDNLNQSPFNVGEVVELQPFKDEQTAALNQQHGAPLASQQIERLQRLVNGHPFLVRRALYLLATGRTRPEALFAQAMSLDGPFGDHLRRLLLMLYERPQLAVNLRQIIEEGRCDDQIAFFRLRGAGFVREAAGRIVVGNELYKATFAHHFELSQT